MATLQDAIDEIQDEVGTLTGMRLAPDEPPDQLSVWPAAIAYAATGTWDTQTTETKIGLHNINIDVMVPRKDLARDVQRLMPYADSLPNALFLALLDGTFSAIQTFGTITYSLLGTDYNGHDVLTLRFVVNDVKMTSSIA